MEENRFLRVYQEHKKEKELEKQLIKPNYENRFECLRDRPQINQEINRFECLRDNISRQDARINRETSNRETSNRFNCLIDDNYRSDKNLSQRIPEQREITYLPRPEPRESINSQMKRFRDEKKIEIKPILSTQSEYHFPELCRSQPEKPIILPEQKQKKKEMIVNTVIIPNNKKTISVCCFVKGKMILKEVYEDGTKCIEPGTVLVKKSNYSSWASVLKEDKNEIIYYDKEENLK